jgi:hypothetical protein
VRILALLLLIGCKEADQPCTCKPTNVSKAASSETVMPLLRRHRNLVGRDQKLVDDEIRSQMIALCNPCGEWVGDRMTVDEMVPVARLDDAIGVVCLGLTLRDGSTVFGERPNACRI